METSSDMLYYHSALADSLPLDNDFVNPDLGLFDSPSDPSSPSMFMKRTTLSKAERRAEHNAIERARRENLNGKFQQLAEALPNLQNYRRPSKGQIVEKALDWVRQSIIKEDRYQYQILQLQSENKQLMMQLNLRQQESKLVPRQMVSTSDSPVNPSTQASYYHYQYQQQQQQQQQQQIMHHHQHQQQQQHHHVHHHQQQTHQPQETATVATSTTLPPQLTSSPYSNATDSRRGSSFMEDDDDRGDLSSMDTYSLSTMMPGVSPDICFYNPMTNLSLPSPMDPSSWEKLATLTTPALVHPTDLSF